jgi:hypothetical protein
MREEEKKKGFCGGMWVVHFVTCQLIHSLVNILMTILNEKITIEKIIKKL